MAFQQADYSQDNTSLQKGDLIRAMTQAIVDVAAPERIILFGSQARGTANQDSDYDFLVIDSEPFGRGRSRLNTIDQIACALTKFEVSKDILLYSAEEVNHRRHWRSNVIAQALKEGQLLYETS